MSEACVINIGPRERRKRLTFGIILLAIAGGIAAFQLTTGQGRWWRLSLFLPFWASGLGFFQAFDKT